MSSKMYMLSLFLLSTLAKVYNVDVYVDGQKNLTLTVDSDTATTNCRSLDLKISDMKLDDSIDKVELYNEWGCGGSPAATVTASSHATGYYKSCKISYKKDSAGSLASNTTTSTTAPATNSSTNAIHAAILFEGENYSGIKHWVDGTVGECRGLSGIEVASVQMVASPGADASQGISDDVTLAFFSDFGCGGYVVGGVTGGHPILDAAMNQTMATGKGLYVGKGTDNSTNTDGTSYGSSTNSTSSVINGAKSVRFVKTGLDNKFYSMSYDGSNSASGLFFHPILLVAGLFVSLF